MDPRDKFGAHVVYPNLAEFWRSQQHDDIFFITILFKVSKFDPTNVTVIPIEGYVRAEPGRSYS